MHNSLVCICFIAWEMWRVPPLGGGVVTAMLRNEPSVNTLSTQTQGRYARTPNMPLQPVRARSGMFTGVHISCPRLVRSSPRRRGPADLSPETIT